MWTSALGPSPTTVKLREGALTSLLVTLLNFLSDVQITLHSGLHEQYFMEFQLPGRDTVSGPVNHILMKSGKPPPLAITPPNWGVSGLHSFMSTTELSCGKTWFLR